MPRGLLSNTLLRGPLAAVLGTAAVIIAASYVIPGTEKGAGTPGAIVFLGVVLGLLNALVAAGIILIYRTARVINFAQAAMGSVGGVLTYNLILVAKWPYFLAIIAGLVVAAATGTVIELLIVRRFFSAPRLVLTVATIALGPLIGYGSGFVLTLPLFGDVRDRDITQLIGAARLPVPFDDLRFQIGDLAFPFGFPHLLGLGGATLALVGLGLFLRYTRAGVAVRASSENSERAQLLGINVQGLSTLVWTMAGLLSGMGMILTMTINRSGPGTGVSPAVLVPAIAAAVLAKMRSLPVAISAAVGITVLQEGIRWSFEEHLAVLDVALLLMILVGLLVQREDLQRSEEQEMSSWEATEEIRPTPKEMLEVSGIRIWRWVLAVIALLVVLVFPLAARPGQIHTGSFILIVGIVLLSLVVLTGWASQVSLGQFGLVGIAAVVAAGLTQKVGISFWLAVPLVAVFSGGLAILLGIPALRIRGLYLAVVSLSFALAVQTTLFNRDYFGWLLPDKVERPTLFFFDFEEERSMYYLSLAALLLAVVVVTSLRRSRTGRVLIALRENEPNVQSFGVNLVRTRLSAFALSGFLCGFAGVLLAHHQRAVTADSFRAEESLMVFMTAVIGGISSISGALIGAAYFGMTKLFSANAIIAFLSQGGALIILLFIAPGGLAAVASSVRDAVLRIVAQRRQMIVPSLFADYDPQILSRRLAPLAEPIPNAGLAALPLNRRYKVFSELFAGAGRRGDGRRRPPSREGVAIVAAAASVGAEEQETGSNEGTQP